MSEPAVSIITVAGSALAKIAQTLQAQTLQQWEWVIVVSSAGDSTIPDTLQTLRQTDDPRVRVLEQPHYGLAAARNAGAAAARAPLLLFFDGEHTLAPTTLEKLAWLLHSDTRPAFAATWYKTAEGFERQSFDARDQVLFEHAAPPAVMIRHSVFDAVGGFDEAQTDELADRELWLRCAARGYWGRDIPEVLVHEQRETAANNLRGFHQQMRANYPALYRDGLPNLAPADDRPHPSVPNELPFANELARTGTRRLLYLLPQLDLGGVSTFALMLLERLRAHGYECTVCTTMPVEQPLLDAFERVADVFVLHHFLRPADAPQFVRYLIGSRGIDVVMNTNSLFGYRLLPYLRAHCPGVALIDYNHMRDPGSANGGFPGFSTEYHTLLDAQLTSSADVRDWMLARGAPAERTHVLYTPADVERWQPDTTRRAQVRAELGVKGDTPLILHIARITAQKQPQVLAEALRELSRRNVQFQCVVAGDGPDMPWLRGFVRHNNLEDRVRLLGTVNAERVRNLMAAGDLLFLPSAYEGLSVALFEAMACGVVPITVDAGGQRELVTQDCGVLVPPDERQAARYVAALEWLLRAPRQRAAMAAAARERVVNHFNAVDLAERFDALAEESLGVARARDTMPLGAGVVAASAAVEELRVYIRNHRLRGVVRAWEWWKRHGTRYVAMVGEGRQQVLRRTYPLRRAVRPFAKRWRDGQR